MGLGRVQIMRLSEGEGMSQSVSMEPGVYEFLIGSDWPGKVRKLENAVARLKHLRRLRTDCSELISISF